MPLTAFSGLDCQLCSRNMWPQTAHWDRFLTAAARHRVPTRGTDSSTVHILVNCTARKYRSRKHLVRTNSRLTRPDLQHFQRWNHPRDCEKGFRDAVNGSVREIFPVSPCHCSGQLQNDMAFSAAIDRARPSIWPSLPLSTGARPTSGQCRSPRSPPGTSEKVPRGSPRGLPAAH